MRKKTILKIGDKYGLLTIDSIADKISSRPAYLCQCNCGAKKVIEARSIASGKTRSCGCLRSVIGQAHIGFPYKTYIGKRVDRLLILEYDYSKIGNGAHLICRCDCGTIKTIEARKLNHNQVKSCGCKHEEQKQLFKKLHRTKYVK